MICCQICGQKLKTIGSHLRKRHGITSAEYVEKYGGSLSSLETRIKRSKYSKLRKYESRFNIDWDTVGLGEKPDSVIAREYNVNRKAVSQARQERGIPIFWGLILTQEDTPCRSIYEAMYDAYLHWQGIPHKHEVKIPNLPYVADFEVDGQYVEIAAMLKYPRYAEKYAKKRQVYEDSNIKVTWLTLEDVEKLYAECPIKLRFRTRFCADCGKETHDLVKGFCRNCNNRRWTKAGDKEVICPQCGKTFTYNGNQTQKFCSHHCYSKSLEVDLPPWDEIDERLKVTSTRQLAFDLGIKPGTLYMRLARRKKRMIP